MLFKWEYLRINSKSDTQILSSYTIININASFITPYRNPVYVSTEFRLGIMKRPVAEKDNKYTYFFWGGLGVGEGGCSFLWVVFYVHHVLVMCLQSFLLSFYLYSTKVMDMSQNALHGHFSSKVVLNLARSWRRKGAGGGCKSTHRFQIQICA